MTRSADLEREPCPHSLVRPARPRVTARGSLSFSFSFPHGFIRARPRRRLTTTVGSDFLHWCVSSWSLASLSTELSHTLSRRSCRRSRRSDPAIMVADEMQGKRQSNRASEATTPKRQRKRRRPCKMLVLIVHALLHLPGTDSPRPGYVQAIIASSAGVPRPMRQNRCPSLNSHRLQATLRPEPRSRGRVCYDRARPRREPVSAVPRRRARLHVRPASERRLHED